MSKTVSPRHRADERAGRPAHRGPSDARYRAIVESAIDFAIVGTDRDGCITDWNVGAERVLGWPAAEMLGQTMERFFTPEDRLAGQPAAEMAGALADGHASDERWHLRQDGSRFWASGEMTRLHGEDGSHIGFVKILRDRTPQHEFGRTLQGIVERYQALAATQQAVNGAGEDLAGVMRAVVDGALAAVPTADGAAIAMREGDEIVYRVATGTSGPHVGVRLRIGDSLSGLCMRRGRPHLCIDSEVDPRVDRVACRRVGIRSMLVVPIAHHGAFIGALKLHSVEPNAFDESDVPAAQLLVGSVTAGLAGRAEADAISALRASEDHFRQTVELNPQVPWTCDPAGNITSYSTRWLELTGQAPGEPDGSGWTKALHPDDLPHTIEIFSGSLASGDPVDVDYRVKVAATGEYRWMRARAFPRRDAAGAIIRWYGVVEDIHDRKRAEAHQRLLIDELNHRVKNTLANVQSLAVQSIRGAQTPEAVQASLMPRLFALAGAHEILTRESWEAADLRDLVAATVALHAGAAPDRFRTQGPSVRLPPRAALAFSMALHELATNAVKYGALSNQAGHVEIAWNVAGTDVSRLTLHWRETGGPSVSPPTHKGSGSRLIERSLAAELGAAVALTYAPAGLTCLMEATLGHGRSR